MDAKMSSLGRKKRRQGAKRLKRRKAPERTKIQEIALMNREEIEEESSGSESDEWYEGDEHDEYAYSEGGYYKVAPGDVLNKRYKVHKRMGWGHFSQVYLATDKTDESYVACKVQKTGEDYRTAGEEEVSYHQALNKVDVPDSHVCRMKDSFDVYSNRGKHVTMVFEVMSTCLFELLDWDTQEPGLPLGVVRCITREVLMGVGELHAAGLIHTDLKPENVMLGAYKTPDNDALQLYKRKYDFHASQKDLEQAKFKLEHHKLNKKQKKRLKQRIQKLEKKVADNLGLLTLPDEEQDEYEETKEALKYLGNSVISEQKAHVKLVDLGTACRTTDKNDYEIGTRNYRAPECIVGQRFGQEIDVWAVACMVVELISGDVLFDPDEEDEEDNFDNDMRNAVHLKQIMEALGKFPKHMQSREMFNRKNELLLVQLADFQGFDAYLRGKVPSLDDEDLEDLCKFLLPMLQIDPKKRLDAKQCLESPWLNVTKVDLTDIGAWLEDLDLEHDADDEEEEEESEDEDEF